MPASGFIFYFINLLLKIFMSNLYILKTLFNLIKTFCEN